METMTQELAELFDFAPPKSLQKSLHEVFFSYITNNKQTLPDDFDTIASDFYFLIRFLQIVDGKQYLTTDYRQMCIEKISL